jgi:tRNA modification GTPase
MFHVKHSVPDWKGDTIAAIASPPGEGGIGVIRISGSDALPTLLRLFSPAVKGKISTHQLVHGWIKNPKTKAKIDEVFACYMRPPRTYTGEAVVEIYGHGSQPIMEAILRLVLAAGARLAERGEFTRRAFLNGKMDLAQAEAVIDLVKAKTVEGAGLALQQLEGRLSGEVEKIKEKIMAVLVRLEASIDFEEEVKTDYCKKSFYKNPTLKCGKSASLLARLRKAEKEIDALLAGEQASKIYRNGVSAVIVGRPNVGKSSLLNALLKEERAIVTAEPGTTRDAIEETINIRGLPVKLVDTAGLRETKNRIEIIGIRRAKKEIEAGEILIVVTEAEDGITREEKKLLEENRSKKKLVVFNKIDKLGKLGKGGKGGPLKGSKMAKEGAGAGVKILRVSALTGEGVDNLLKAIYNLAIVSGVGSFKNAALLNARHKNSLLGAREALQKAIAAIIAEEDVACVAVEVKESIMKLGEITGEQVSEAVINQIFEKFCVGK